MATNESQLLQAKALRRVIRGRYKVPFDELKEIATPDTSSYELIQTLIELNELNESKGMKYLIDERGQYIEIIKDEINEDDLIDSAQLEKVETLLQSFKSKVQSSIDQLNTNN